VQFVVADFMLGNTFSFVVFNLIDVRNYLLRVMDWQLQWIELHGDRGGFDDPAMVCGVGSIDGMSFVFIGQQKGRNTKENIHRNFAMPMPNGYVYVRR
jgi:acetyl-CoA carboxylase alpha subunit